MASTLRLPASMLDSALRGIPSFLATSSCFSPTYSRASLRRSPSTWRSLSADGCGNVARSLLMGLLLLCWLVPGSFCLEHEIVDARLGAVVAALWPECRRDLDAQQLLDRADDLYDDQRIDFGLPRPRCSRDHWGYSSTGTQDRLVCGLICQRIPDARLGLWCREHS